MEKALGLARKGQGLTSPNPCVGAVVVKDNKVIAGAFHKRAGQAHAEALALKKAGRRANGSTLYVTLEPCNHFGKTPPCTDTVIKSGVKRVVVGMTDPNPVNSGKGLARLKRNGIAVKTGVLRKEAESLNIPFVKFIKERIPYVTVKVAQTLDGKIATKTGDSKWISNDASRRFVHVMRERVDCVLVGINTILKDDPLLTPRLGRPSRKNVKRVIIDSHLKIPLKSKVLKNPESLIIATTKKASKKKLLQLTRKKVDIIITKDKKGQVNLKSFLKELAQRNISHILVEGGGNIVSSFLKENLVDEMLIFISPKIVGGRDAVTSVEGDGVKFVDEAIPLSNIKVERFGTDILVRGHVYRPD